MFQALETSDLGCGAGGGRNNADVFHLAGLTFLTNANADDTQENGKMFSIFCLLFKLVTEIYINHFPPGHPYRNSLPQYSVC